MNKLRWVKDADGEFAYVTTDGRWGVQPDYAVSDRTGSAYAVVGWHLVDRLDESALSRYSFRLREAKAQAEAMS